MEIGTALVVAVGLIVSSYFSYRAAKEAREAKVATHRNEVQLATTNGSTVGRMIEAQERLLEITHVTLQAHLKDKGVHLR